jgi:ABC-type multidrug transport system permease subunit
MSLLRVLVDRTLNEIRRVPGATVPAVVAPTLVLLGITGVLGKLADTPDFIAAPNYITFLLPWGLLQAASFAGGATGVNLARDVEEGFLDRLLVSPMPRALVLLSNAVGAAARTVPAIVVMLVVAALFGADFPGIGGVLVMCAAALGFAMIAAGWAMFIALVTRSQSAAPLMQAPVLVTLILTSAFAPIDNLAGWMRTIAQVNPVTAILNLGRDAFTASLEWDHVWPGVLALVGGAALLYGLAWKRLQRT